jgi:glutamate-ammonia-ligase adenylyltransferase
LWGAIDPEVVGRQITRVAEVCLEEAYRQALARLVEKYGQPREEDGAPARFAVLGLGKLGGGEIDYHSDLDVLFLYSGQGATRRPDGGRGLSNGEFFARLAQRIMGALTTRTREGIAFRMDARLRPSGQAGPLVTSLEAFEAYHEEGSQTWEKQTLVRLRPVAGDADLGQATRAAMRRVLYGSAPSEDPRREIVRMRERIEREVAREDQGRADLKAGFGGIVDVEFAVQALQLQHGWQAEELQSPNTLEALQALRRRGLVAEGHGKALQEGYQFLRRVEARLRILSERPTDALPQDPTRLGELVRGLGYEIEMGNAALMADLQQHRQRIRESYECLLQGEPT